MTDYEISLKPVTKENWRACVALSVAESQIDFVPSNLYSIAEAQFFPDAQSTAVYADDRLVGYALYGIDEQRGQWKIFRLMIDKKEQRKGYGKLVMQHIIQAIQTEFGATQIFIAYQSQNRIAQRLYAKLGFEKVETEAGVITAMLKS